MYSGIHKSRDKYCGFEIEFKPGNKQDVSVLKQILFIYLFIVQFLHLVTLAI